MPEQSVLLISRDDILSLANGDEGDQLFRRLARLTRKGYQLLATAPQPDRWSQEHGGPDDALLGPDSIRKRLYAAGGVIDGVYYVRRSLLTQRRNREEALRDILSRYATNADHCYLLSSSKKFVEAAERLGIHAHWLSEPAELMESLRTLGRARRAAAKQSS